MHHHLVIGALCLAACGAPHGVTTHKDDMNTGSLSIDVQVTGEGTPAITARCVAKNVSDHALNVFDSRRMPYLLDDHGTLVILHGVTPAPEDRDLNAVEIPTTRVLAVGEVLAFDVPLAPLRLRDHYGDVPQGPPRHGAATVVCRVAHGDTPIDAAARASTGISTLLAWQRLESSPPLVVQLP
jgi:hypothetical protein